MATPSSVGFVMLNCDGCTLGNLGKLGIGDVVRDPLGIVLKTSS